MTALCAARFIAWHRTRRLAQARHRAWHSACGARAIARDVRGGSAWIPQVTPGRGPGVARVRRSGRVACRLLLGQCEPAAAAAGAIQPSRSIMSKKVLALGLLPSDNQGDSGGPFLRVTGGDYYVGRYDVSTTSVIFWRGDTRAPSEVFKTGFSSRHVRDGRGREIVWRAGVDDIVPASAVCMARDIRGAAFFPCPDGDTDDVDDSPYLYAMVVPFAASIYRIRQTVEKAETGANHWRDPKRFHYDPTGHNRATASCVWQFAEYAVHEVEPSQILGGWQFDRKFLVRMKDEERGQAGIRFRVRGAMHKNPRCLNVKAQARAKEIAERYGQEYPARPHAFLSYWGVVRASKAPVSSRQEAEQTVTQIERILTDSDEDWSRRDDVVGDGAGAIRLGASGIRLSSSKCHL
jgi:hypothetical protein